MNINLQRNVRSAIGKSDALFYQRSTCIKMAEKSRSTLAPEMQPAKVSDDDVDQVCKPSAVKQLQYEDVDINEWQGLGLKYPTR